MTFSVIKKYGKVSIEDDRGYYRLRWTYRDKRLCLAIGRADTEAALLAAEAKAQQINSDLMMDRFDESLARYSQKHADALKAKKKGLDLREVWEKYKQASADRVAKTTQEAWWKATDGLLLKLPSNLLLLDKARPAVAKMLEIYSPETVRRNLSDLIAACNWAVREGLIEKNPYAGMKRELPKKSPSKRSREHFESNEIKAILKEFRKDEVASYYANYVEMLALTGFRPEEAIALTWDDVISDESGKTFLKVNKAFSKGQLKPTKTYDTRDFPCNDQLTAFLENLPRLPNGKNLIFPSPTGLHLDQSNFSGRQWRPTVKKLAKEKKVKQYLPCYNLRHSFITRLIQEGIDVATAAKLAGNSPQVIFDHYLAARTDVTLPDL
jgi:integrase